MLHIARHAEHRVFARYGHEGDYCSEERETGSPSKAHDWWDERIALHYKIPTQLGSIGVAGMRPLEERHQRDLFENSSHPWFDIVDEISSAASLLMGQSNEALPVVILRGIHYTIEEQAELRSGFAS